MNIQDIQKIEGLENYTETAGSGVLWIKILNSSAATAAKMPSGTVVVGRDNEVLAKPEEAFNFIPLFFFTDWSIWSERQKNQPSKLIKRTFDGKVWTDGTKVLDHEINWIGNTPPLATETLNFVVVPLSEIKRELAEGEERRNMILAIQMTNKQRKKLGRELKSLIAVQAVEQKVAGIYQLGFSLTSEVFTNDNNDAWYDFSQPKFLKVVNEATALIGKTAYQKVKTLNQSSLALEAHEEAKQIAAPKVEPVTANGPVSIKNPMAVAAEIMANDPVPAVDMNADF